MHRDGRAVNGRSDENRIGFINEAAKVLLYAARSTNFAVIFYAKMIREPKFWTSIYEWAIWHPENDCPTPYPEKTHAERIDILIKVPKVWRIISHLYSSHCFCMSVDSLQFTISCGNHFYARNIKGF